MEVLQLSLDAVFVSSGVTAGRQLVRGRSQPRGTTLVGSLVLEMILHMLLQLLHGILQNVCNG